MAALLFIAAAALLCVLLWQGREAHTFAGVTNAPPVPAPNFLLTDDTGSPFELAALRGRWIFVTYGYTHCPDVCPLTLANLKQVVQQAGAGADQVRVVFVTVDPGRDTVPVMHDYVTHFSPDFTGLTGAPAAVAIAGQAFSVRSTLAPASPAGAYAVSHSAYVYLIDPQFRWRLTYPFGVTPEEMSADLRYLMQHPG